MVVNYSEFFISLSLSLFYNCILLCVIPFPLTVFTNVVNPNKFGILLFWNINNLRTHSHIYSSMILINGHTNGVHGDMQVIK